LRGRKKGDNTGAYGRKWIIIIKTKDVRGGGKGNGEGPRKEGRKEQRKVRRRDGTKKERKNRRKDGWKEKRMLKGMTNEKGGKDQT
jgi:hypothetical protein